MAKIFVAETINYPAIPHAFVTGYSADPQWQLDVFRVTIKGDGFEIVPDGMTALAVKQNIIPQHEIDRIIAILQTKIAVPGFDGFYADVLINGATFKARIATASE